MPCLTTRVALYGARFYRLRPNRSSEITKRKTGERSYSKISDQVHAKTISDSKDQRNPGYCSLRNDTFSSHLPSSSDNTQPSRNVYLTFSKSHLPPGFKALASYLSPTAQNSTTNSDPSYNLDYKAPPNQILFAGTQTLKNLYLHRGTLLPSPS